MKKTTLLTLFSLGVTIQQCVLADMPAVSSTISETYERVSSGDIACESRSPHPTINAGMYDANKTYQPYNNGNISGDRGVYVAVTIPLTVGSSKVGCADLYRATLRKEQLRVEQLEIQIQQLKGRTITAE